MQAMTQATAQGARRRGKVRGNMLDSVHAVAADPQTVITRYALIVHPHPERQQLIAEAAYHKAEARGFAPGHELDDWLAAEAEVDARLYGEQAA